MPKIQIYGCQISFDNNVTPKQHSNIKGIQNTPAFVSSALPNPPELMMQEIHQAAISKYPTGAAADFYPHQDLPHKQ